MDLTGRRGDATLRLMWLALLLVSTMTLAGCEIVGDIFKAGAWMGALAVIFVVGLIAFIATKVRG